MTVSSLPYFVITALQLVEYPYGDGIEVVFAGGRRKLMHKNQTDPEYPDKKGERLDGRDLIKEWVNKHQNSKYVWNKTEFEKINVEEVDHVIGTKHFMRNKGGGGSNQGMHNVLIAIWCPILNLQIYMLTVTGPLESSMAGLILLIMTEIKVLFICK